MMTSQNNPATVSNRERGHGNPPGDASLYPSAKLTAASMHEMENSRENS